jgi:BirA family biotin operon repressor/biotin-[acetyl-CoA-carboxylase] ligase
MDLKQKIISKLKQANTVVSGEALSAELGVSRVAIWKHMKRLSQSGLSIVSSPKGYRLNHDPDSLLPWEFGTRSNLIHHFLETASTMDVAMDLARKGCPDFTVAVAQRQTRGRGRLRRTWLSESGGLYFTVVTRPDIPMILAGLVNLAAAIDMADILRSQFQVDARLKWPNDILVGKHKICGILSQMETEGDRVAHLNIGIGLNINNTPQIDEPIAVSLNTLLGRHVDRREILVAFLNSFERRILTFDEQTVIEAWRSNNVTLGQKVRVVNTNGMIDGTAVDVDSHGGLLIRLADGAVRTVFYGDCFTGSDNT